MMRKMEEMLKELQEKEDELADVESLNQTLVVKERMTNEELQEARKALIDVSFKHFIEFFYLLLKAYSTFSSLILSHTLIHTSCLHEFKNLKDMSNHGSVGVKWMGELDNSAFRIACKRKYPEEMAEFKAAELCSLCEEDLKDPHWHPFKMIEVDGEHKVCTQFSLHEYLFYDD